MNTLKIWWLHDVMLYQTLVKSLDLSFHGVMTQVIFGSAYSLFSTLHRL